MKHVLSFCYLFTFLVFTCPCFAEYGVDLGFYGVVLNEPDLEDGGIGGYLAVHGDIYKVSV